MTNTKSLIIRSLVVYNPSQRDFLFPPYSVGKISPRIIRSPYQIHKAWHYLYARQSLFLFPPYSVGKKCPRKNGVLPILMASRFLYSERSGAKFAPQRDFLLPPYSVGKISPRIIRSPYKIQVNIQRWIKYE